MARKLRSVFYASCFLLLLHLVLNSTASKAQSVQSNKNVSLFIFGDSYLDAGNNNYINTTTIDQANFWPYEETFFNFPTGRFSDGRLISDFIAQYTNLPLILPDLQPSGIDEDFFGVNFASDGADALVETFQGHVIPLKMQLRYYKKVEDSLTNKLGYDKAKKIISEVVYLFSIKTNYYTKAFLINSIVIKPYSLFVETMIGNLTSHVQEIYKIGGRKFAFINLPPLGCLPAMRILRPEDNGTCLEEASLIGSLHNRALSNLLLELEMQWKGFKYAVLDFESNLQRRMEHPSKFGM